MIVATPPAFCEELFFLGSRGASTLPHWATTIGTFWVRKRWLVAVKGRKQKGKSKSVGKRGARFGMADRQPPFSPTMQIAPCKELIGGTGHGKCQKGGDSSYPLSSDKIYHSLITYI